MDDTLNGIWMKWLAAHPEYKTTPGTRGAAFNSFLHGYEAGCAATCKALRSREIIEIPAGVPPGGDTPSDVLLTGEQR
jgi:hypothetical protein